MWMTITNKFASNILLMMQNLASGLHLILKRVRMGHAMLMMIAPSIENLMASGCHHQIPPLPLDTDDLVNPDTSAAGRNLTYGV